MEAEEPITYQSRLSDDLPVSARLFQGHGLSSPPICHVCLCDLFYRCRTGLSHDHLKLASHDLEHPLDARLPERRQSPKVRPADANGICAERQRFGDICSPAKPSIDEHGNLSTHAFHDFRQAFDGRAIALFSAPAVIRYDDAVNAMLDCKLSVLARDEALDDQLHRSSVFQTFDDLPGHVQRVLSDDPG